MMRLKPSYIYAKAPNNDPPDRNRQHSNRIHNKKENNTQSKKNKRNWRREETLIKDTSSHENSTRKTHIAEIAKELRVQEQMPILSKDPLKSKKKQK